ncbi:MAG: hypothetical protein P1V36_18435, partial [Planctomycetota bacterium]|nr:hypothetical protein [Planctomycetota bacterium]
MAWLRRRKIKRTGRVHYYLAWRDEDGAERTRPLNTTDKIVAEALLREHQRASGELPAAPRGAPAEILEQFLAEKAVQFRPKTVADYRDRLGPLFAAWSDHPMETWTRAMFVSHVEGMGPRSVQILVGQCRRLIEWARGLDLPLPDFVGDFKPPAVRSEERTALTVEEEAAVMKVARGGRLEAPIALALYGGMPRADFLALEWRQVDLEA